MRALLFATVVASSACSSGQLPEHHARSVDGTDVVYHVAGHGPTTIVHAGGPGLAWSYLRMPALENVMTMVYIEPIGTGSSGRLVDPDGYTLHAYADSIEAVRSEVVEAGGDERVFLIGHSHGGKIAQQYAAEHADHLRGLVLYSTSAVSDADWNKAVEDSIQTFSTEPWFADKLAAMSSKFPPADGGPCAHLAAIAPFYFADYTTRHDEFDPWIASLRCWPISTKHDTPHDDLRPRLAGMPTPTLVITGRRDWLFPDKYARLTAAALPRATVTVLEHSGHFGHLEEPHAFDSAIITFVMTH